MLIPHEYQHNSHNIKSSCQAAGFEICFLHSRKGHCIFFFQELLDSKGLICVRSNFLILLYNYFYNLHYICNCLLKLNCFPNMLIYFFCFFFILLSYSVTFIITCHNCYTILYAFSFSFFFF